MLAASASSACRVWLLGSACKEKLIAWTHVTGFCLLGRPIAMQNTIPRSASGGGGSCKVEQPSKSTEKKWRCTLFFRLLTDAPCRFRQERSQAIGKTMWEERRAVAHKDDEDIRDINKQFKYHICMGLVLVVVLAFALGGLYEQFTTTMANAGKSGGVGNSTAHGVHETPMPMAKSRMPPVGVIAFVFVAGFGVPTAFLIWRQRMSRSTRSFQAEI